MSSISSLCLLTYYWRKVNLVEQNLIYWAFESCGELKVCSFTQQQQHNETILCLVRQTETHLQMCCVTWEYLWGKAMMSQMAFKRVSSCKPAQGKDKQKPDKWLCSIHLFELLLFFVGEVTIQVGSPEGGLQNGGSLRPFPNDKEQQMSMGTSTYNKNLFFFFPPFFPSCFFELSWSAPFLLVFLNLPDPSN